MRLRVCLGLATGLVVSTMPAVNQVPVPGQGKAAARQEPRPEETRPVFEFHNGFWINLHHFLYQQARILEQRPTSRTPVVEKAPEAAPSNIPVAAPAAVPARPPDASQESAWQMALNYYRRYLAGRDLVFSSDMVAIKNRLAELEHCPPSLGLSGTSNLACGVGLQAELVAVLDQAAPIYLAYWWKEHDRANRQWIAQVTSLVRAHGAPLAERLAGVYQMPWPVGRIRVDVGIYAGPFGGYTTLDPLHVTIASTDPRNQGHAALEMLFHQASHGLAAPVADAIARRCRALNKPIPRDLWHALLFYTTGEIVKRSLREAGSKSASEKDETSPAMQKPEECTPCADRYDLYARGWQAYRRLLVQHWQPYLDGRIELERAVARLVAAL